MTQFSELPDSSLVGDGPGPRSEAKARRVTLVAVAILASLMAGVGALFLPSMLIVGAIGSIFGVLAVLRSPFLGLIIYMVVFVMRVGEMFPALAPLRIERMIGLLTILSLVLSQLQSQGRLTLDWSPTTKRFLGVLVAASLTVPLAYWRAAAITGVVDFIKLFLLYWMIIALVDTRRRLRAFFVLYLGLVSYIGASSLFEYFKGDVLQVKAVGRAIGATSAGGGPNELGATMATTAVIFVVLFMERRVRRWRPLCGVLAMMCLVVLALSGSRSALVGLMGGLTYIWWNSKHRLVFGVLGLLFLAAAYTQLPDEYQDRYASIAESNVNIDTSQERLKVWKKGLEMFASRPITGVGVHCFGTANAMNFVEGGRRSYLESHSLYVQVLAEMGIVGAFAFFWFLFSYMQENRKLIRQARGGDWALEETLLEGVFVGSIVLLATGVFGHSLMRPTWYIYAALVVAVARVREREGLEQQARPLAFDANPSGSDRST